MKFKIPEYKAPDFTSPKLANAPDCRFEAADRDGVAPEYFHSTSMFPEYFKVNGEWKLAEESRMDSSVVLRPDGRLDVVENRNLCKGDLVALGRSEDGREGIFVHTRGFEDEETELDDQFVFRQGRSRETSYARDYDRLFDLLNYEKEHGNIVWVMGPAFAFDHDARACMQALVENGVGQSHERQKLCALAFAVFDFTGFFQRLPDGHTRVQRADCVLEYHLDRDVVRPLYDSAARPLQADQRLRDRRLPAAGLSDDSENLAPVDGEAHALHRLELPVVDMQVAYAEDDLRGLCVLCFVFHPSRFLRHLRNARLLSARIQCSDFERSS